MKLAAGLLLALCLSGCLGLEIANIAVDSAKLANRARTPSKVQTFPPLPTPLPTVLPGQPPPPRLPF